MSSILSLGIVAKILRRLEQMEHFMPSNVRRGRVQLYGSHRHQVRTILFFVVSGCKRE